MVRYKKGDVLICKTEKMYGMTYPLKVGEKYIVNNFLEMPEKNLVSVNSNKGQYIGVFDDRLFIPIEVWREFQLRKLLK